FDGGLHFVLHRFRGRDARLQGNVHHGNTALYFIDLRNHRRFRDFADRQAGGFYFLGAEAVAGDVDDVVDPPKDTVIAVGGKHGAIGSVIRPVAPVLALGILVVLLVILVEETLGVAPDGLHDPGPGIADANISSGAG